MLLFYDEMCCADKYIYSYTRSNFFFFFVEENTSLHSKELVYVVFVRYPFKDRRTKIIAPH